LKAPLSLPSVEFLKECFRYERSTGKLFWRKRPARHFVNTKEWRRWNTRYAGAEAFPQTTNDGHKRGRLSGHSILAHRVVWKIVTGKEPPDIIDHKDRDEANNRWKNLRAASTTQNCINGSRSGVHQRKNGKWRARVTFGGKRLHVGDFNSEVEAVAMRALKNRELHGEFAP
jgi:hypothetical protein